MPPPSPAPSPPPITPPSPAAGAFADELTRLPAQPVAAVRVLRLVENEQASAADLARVIETDPALSARVMRLANAPYYGLSGKVASASRAVVLLGFTSVRALAVGAACALLVEHGTSGPPGFWPHAVATAAAASVVARHTGTPPGDAFSAGLLHDLGAALLHRRSPDDHAAAAATSDPPAAERERFGLDHARAGAEVLEAWHFPPAFVRAVSSHHAEVGVVGDSLARLVIAGETLAHLVADGVDTGIDAAFAAVGLLPDRRPRLVADVEREIGAVASFLGVG